MNIAGHISATQVAPTTLVADIQKLCSLATEYQFASVCVPPLFVRHAKALLKETNVKVSAVIGFPFGYSSIEAKLAEILLALVDGVDILEVVANYMAIKNTDWAYVANELTHILPVVKKREKAVKFVIEAGALTNDEIIKCCDLYGVAGIDVLKTSTGYSSRNGSAEVVRTMRSHLADVVQVEAFYSGTELGEVYELVEAGASVIATADPVSILKAH